MEILFGGHTSQLSEVFREALDEFLRAHANLIMDGINATFWGQRFEDYASAMKEKTKALRNSVDFIYGTVIDVTRPGGK